jgi:hypothetical protein
MVAIPSQKTEGLEYRTRMIEHPVTVNGQQGKEARYLITAHVPVSAEGDAVGLAFCSVAEEFELALFCGGGLTGKSKLHPKRIAAEKTIARTKRDLSIWLN